MINYTSHSSQKIEWAYFSGELQLFLMLREYESSHMETKKQREAGGSPQNILNNAFSVKWEWFLEDYFI